MTKETPKNIPITDERKRNVEDLETYEAILKSISCPPRKPLYPKREQSIWMRLRTKMIPAKKLPEIEMKLCWVASRPGSLEAPNPKVCEIAFLNSHPVGCIKYAVSPLLDCIYCYKIHVEKNARRRGIGTAILLVVSQKYGGLPIVPIYISNAAHHFWNAAARWDQSRLLIYEDVRNLDNEQERFSHLHKPRWRFYQLRCHTIPKEVFFEEYAQGTPGCSPWGKTKTHPEPTDAGAPGDTQDSGESPPRTDQTVSSAGDRCSLAQNDPDTSPTP
ncbi:GNAT family N-acetyltransferase [Acidithiobacillus caldus ATCC 51756]|nr:GNAT family N-acetyltransferase [Acidithiobacillus caldus]MBU2736400.1 GNAT family N-acetyltransferase [Acidithiobacillus caldus ATCC 51756]MBU2743977.1 GNAT family N-acetyltransferase [Acidithiobacillus caldus]MBU2779656.1 GNAT family N-acetyltransferase [Acidithiobacillus caldus]